MTLELAFTDAPLQKHESFIIRSLISQQPGLRLKMGQHTGHQKKSLDNGPVLTFIPFS
jgi:hypothetical protein